LTLLFKGQFPFKKKKVRAVLKTKKRTSKLNGLQNQSKA